MPEKGKSFEHWDLGPIVMEEEKGMGDWIRWVAVWEAFWKR